MNLEQLIAENNTILNGEIVDISTKLIDNSKLVFSLFIRGDNWGCNYGEYDLFDITFDSKQAMINLMTLFEVKTISELIGKNARIAVKDVTDPVKYIGHIIYDNWFNYEDYKIKIDNIENMEEIFNDNQPEEESEENEI